MPFKKLFRSVDKSSDGLTQSAREAIVDVLHYCMYADRHIAVREDEFIETAARTLNWDANISYEYYEGKSTGAVNRALSDKDEKAAFFESLKTRLPGKVERELAIALADDLSLCDGLKKERESAAIRELKTLLVV